MSDGELQRNELSLVTALALRNAGPWGQGFPEPVFDGEFDVLDARIVGEKHLKMRVRAATGCETIDAIAFGYVGGAAEAGGTAAAGACASRTGWRSTSTTAWSASSSTASTSSRPERAAALARCVMIFRLWKSTS
jgi:hypothetical protein